VVALSKQQNTNTKGAIKDGTQNKTITIDMSKNVNKKSRLEAHNV